jgi:squalene-hopene/tetraprenyl-beta-curcumene cyclase
MNGRLIGVYLLACALCVGGAAWTMGAVHGSSRKTAVAWDKAGAARFLDAREVWWQAWPRSQKDHGTLCISCHTQVPYAMVRPSMGSAGDAQRVMMASVEKRVMQWHEMVPFYSDAKNGPGKTVEAHATEAVLNAVILLSYDEQSGTGRLRPVTEMALEHAWALQLEAGKNAGGWIWQNFHLGPWEGDESGYQGAALLLVEVLHAPASYATRAGIRSHLEMLRSYLMRSYTAQPLMSQLYVLWASGTDTSLLSGSQRDQQQADGGWRVMAMDPRERIDHSPMNSDGMATGLAVVAMENSGISRSDQRLARGIAWLRSNQQSDGSWSAPSINKARDPQTDAYLFMTDAATGYAALALIDAR